MCEGRFPAACSPAHPLCSEADSNVGCFITTHSLQVLPTGHSQRLPPLFFLDRSYWGRGSSSSAKTGSTSGSRSRAASAPDLSQPLLLQPGGGSSGAGAGGASGTWCCPTTGQPPAIRLKCLTKEFPLTQVGVSARQLRMVRMQLRTACCVSPPSALPVYRLNSTVWMAKPNLCVNPLNPFSTGWHTGGCGWADRGHCCGPHHCAAGAQWVGAQLAAWFPSHGQLQSTPCWLYMCHPCAHRPMGDFTPTEHPLLVA